MIDYIIAAILMIVCFVLGFIAASLRIRSIKLGTLFINEDVTDPEEAYAYIKFDDDPAIFIEERCVTLEVKKLSQK